MPLPTLPGFLLDLEPEDPITEETVYCMQCWMHNRKEIMRFDPTDNYHICYNQHRLTQEQVQKLDSKYKVIQFPRDEFTGDPIRLTEEQRKEFVKQCLG